MHACARMHIHTHTHMQNMVPRMMAKRRHSIPRGGHGNQPQYSYLENMMDRGVRGLQSVGSQKAGRD